MEFLGIRDRQWDHLKEYPGFPPPVRIGRRLFWDWMDLVCVSHFVRKGYWKLGDNGPGG